MDNINIVLENSVIFAKEKFTNDTTGHDWPHTERVYKMAMNLAKGKKVNMLVVQLAALLHDVDDWKLSKKYHSKNNSVEQWLKSQNINNEIINHICNIIESLSYKGAGVFTSMTTLEGKIVQDADRLDAMGAIGIARAFTFGGAKHSIMHDPQIRQVIHKSFEEYKAKQSTTINHFYEKLLLLKELMNTEEAKQIAEKRHKYMESFLEQFYTDWDLSF